MRRVRARRHVSATASSCGDRSTSRGRHGCEAGRGQHRLRTSAAPRRRRCRAARPASAASRSVKAMPEPVAPPAQVGLGVAEEVGRRRSPAGPGRRPAGSRAAAPAAAGRCRPARTSARERTYDATTSRGSRISSTVGQAGDPGGTGPSGRWWLMCFWYCTLRPRRAAARSSDATARSRSVSPAASTSSRPGWSMPVRGQVGGVQRLVDDDACRGGSPTTASARWRCCGAPTRPRAGPAGRGPVTDAAAGRRRRGRPGRRTAAAAGRRPGRGCRRRCGGRRPRAPAPRRRTCRCRTPPSRRRRR